MPVYIIDPSNSAAATETIQRIREHHPDATIAICSLAKQGCPEREFAEQTGIKRIFLLANPGKLKPNSKPTKRHAAVIAFTQEPGSVLILVRGDTLPKAPAARTFAELNKHAVACPGSGAAAAASAPEEEGVAEEASDAFEGLRELDAAEVLVMFASVYAQIRNMRVKENVKGTLGETLGGIASSAALALLSIAPNAAHPSVLKRTDYQAMPDNPSRVSFLIKHAGKRKPNGDWNNTYAALRTTQQRLTPRQ